MEAVGETNSPHRSALTAVPLEASANINNIIFLKIGLVSQIAGQSVFHIDTTL